MPTITHYLQFIPFQFMSHHLKVQLLFVVNVQPFQCKFAMCHARIRQNPLVFHVEIALWHM